MNIFNRNQTLKPLTNHKKGKSSELHDYAKRTLATLGSGSMKSAVQLPAGENLNEWIAVNTVDFFNELSMLYGTISEYCTSESCPIMCAGSQAQYLWMDGVKVKKPLVVSAPEYVDYLMTWVESQLNDEEIFPIKFDGVFPKRFISICATIYKRFFRIYAHIYHHHIERIKALGADSHLNTCFKHFIYFVNEFKLVDQTEQQPLKEIIEGMMGKDAKEYNQQPKATATGTDALAGADGKDVVTVISSK